MRESGIKGRQHCFEDICAFIGEVVESKEEWLEHRFKVMAKKKKELGQEIILADIRREMRLKPNPYKKYALFIDDLLKELNG